MGNGAGDAEAKTIRVTNGIVANWRLLLDDPNEWHRSQLEAIAG